MTGSWLSDFASGDNEKKGVMVLKDYIALDFLIVFACDLNIFVIFDWG